MLERQVVDVTLEEANKLLALGGWHVVTAYPAKVTYADERHTRVVLVRAV